MSANEITAEELAKVLYTAADTIDRHVAPEVARTANLALETQRANVRRRSGHTADSIKATAPDGRTLGPLDVEAEIGPTWFVGRIIELGLGNFGAPAIFVGNSLDPHLADHQRRVLDAATEGALARLVR